jgi:hypothetical protein
MSNDANAAILQELLDRVQRNRVRLAETRSRAAADPSSRIAEPAPAQPEVRAAPAPIPAPAPQVDRWSEPVPQPIAFARPIPAAPPPPAPEPEAELEPLPDEPPIAEAAPLRAPAAAPDLAPRSFRAEIQATGPVASTVGQVEPSRPWTVAAVLARAWKLGLEREGR